MEIGFPEFCLGIPGKRCKSPGSILPQLSTEQGSNSSEIHYIISQFQDVDSLTYVSGSDVSSSNVSGSDVSRFDVSRFDVSRFDVSGSDVSRFNVSSSDVSNFYVSGSDVSGSDVSGSSVYATSLLTPCLTTTVKGRRFISCSSCSVLNLEKPEKTS